jgi:hypothetical protein
MDALRRREPHRAERAIGQDRLHLATLRLIPVTDGDHTFAEWSAEFDAAPDREEALVADIGVNVFAAGLSALKTRFSR